MSRVIRNLTLALGAAVCVVPSLLAAQPAQGPRGAMQPPMDRQAGRVQRPGAISRLLNARRQLDLTPRQVAQLDSLERIQFAEHKAFAKQMRPVRDSMQARARSGARNPASRDSLRAQARTRMEAQRPQMEQRRKRDSSLSVAAERVLNDTQRQKVRELQAERRGYERGMRESRGQRGGAPGAVRGGRPGGQAGGMRGGMGAQQGRPQGAPQPGLRGPQGPGAPGGMSPRRPPLETPDVR
jgi:hypothetical protein